MPILVEHICDKLAERGRGPLAEPADHPVPPRPETDGYEFTDSRDAERCATESRLAHELLDGTLDRARYRAEMAALAAGAPSSQPPGDP